MLRRIALLLLSSALLAACSQTVGVPPPSLGTAQDYFWTSSALTVGFDYHVVRTGIGTNHLLTSEDGTHIRDAALANETTMIVHSTPDSVIVDSMGTNSIFSLPSGYFFGRVLPADTVPVVKPITDTFTVDTIIYDTATHVNDTIALQRFVLKDTTVQIVHPGDTVLSGLLLLYTPDLDSGLTWQAGTITGPSFPNGIPVTATVLDRVDSLLVPSDSSAGPGAAARFGESLQIRFSPSIPGGSAATAPIYWLAYFSKGMGPVLVQQYLLINGSYVVTQRAQYIGKGS